MYQGRAASAASAARGVYSKGSGFDVVQGRVKPLPGVSAPGPPDGHHLYGTSDVYM